MSTTPQGPQHQPSSDRYGEPTPTQQITPETRPPTDRSAAAGDHTPVAGVGSSVGSGSASEHRYPDPQRHLAPSRDTGDRVNEASGATDYRRSATDHDSVRAREKEAFGGIKFGSAFFGWLTTVGATVILIAIASAIATAINADNELSTQDLRNAGIGAAIGVLVILFIAYFAGGYVAGRMARFNGARQGVAVWLWAVIIAVILTIVGVVAGNQTDITGQANLPDIPVDSADLTAAGLIALAIVLVVTLVAAILGGLAGMRFHRRVDRAGFDTSRDDAPFDQGSR
ncbi:MAG: YrzE family protein [Actinomycetota bacterium]|nr:YrzE family protein [Actinomycetota bacterium]